MSHLDTARRVLATETRALQTLADGLDARFADTVDALAAVPGRIILTGVGKSGHVARKIAATLASTGSPASYVHPTEASHGDLGMIARGDAVIALSRSGETAELSDIVTYCGRHAIPLIAITAAPDSTLARAADHLLQLPDAPEACAATRAPTTSTTMQIALGDALAVALLEAKGFTAGDFQSYHPGGQLGASLLTLSDLMHADLPLVAPDMPVTDAVEVLARHGFGCVGIVEDGRLIGIVTDGDIRRHITGDLTASPISALMTRDPITAAPEDRAAATLARMTDGMPQILQVFIVEDDRPIGLVHLHDLLRAGLG